MSTLKQYKDLEKALQKEAAEINGRNIVKLENGDFSDGKFTREGYNRLKRECEYFPHRDGIEIVVPKDCAEDFQKTLTAFGAAEIAAIRREIRSARILAIFLLLIGVGWYVLRMLLSGTNFFHEVTIIVSWVFVWAATEKFFFETGKHRKKRLNILHILSGKIIIAE